MIYFFPNNPETLALHIAGQQLLKDPSGWYKGSMKGFRGSVSMAPYLRSIPQTIRCLMTMFLMILCTAEET